MLTGAMIHRDRSSRVFTGHIFAHEAPGDGDRGAPLAPGRGSGTVRRAEESHRCHSIHRLGTAAVDGVWTRG